MTKGEASASSAPTMPFRHTNRGQVGPVVLFDFCSRYGKNGFIFPLGLFGESLRLFGVFSILVAFGFVQRFTI
jgi:hypothetical protein